MSTSISKILAIVEEDAMSVKKRVAKRSMEMDEQTFILASTCQANKAMRNEKLFRRRWDEPYLRELATREKSFVAEYRLDPSSFDILSGMLEMYPQVDKKMSQISTKSGPISTNSRLGAALIILAGGRRVESMRTHGVSQAFVYENLRRVIRSINEAGHCMRHFRKIHEFQGKKLLCLRGSQPVQVLCWSN